MRLWEDDVIGHVCESYIYANETSGSWFRTGTQMLQGFIG